MTQTILDIHGVEHDFDQRLAVMESGGSEILVTDHKGAYLVSPEAIEQMKVEPREPVSAYRGQPWGQPARYRTGRNAFPQAEPEWDPWGKARE